jgi:hypothetical protein
LVKNGTFGGGPKNPVLEGGGGVKNGPFLMGMTEENATFEAKRLILRSGFFEKIGHFFGIFQFFLVFKYFIYNLYNLFII